MKSFNQEDVERVLEHNPQFREVYEEHHRFDKKIAKMDKKRHLTDEEILEKKRLKKLKLSKKDEMEKILAEAVGS